MQLLQLINIPNWLLWTFILGVAAYWYLTKNHGYWQKHGIPYVPAVPIFGSLLSNFIKHVHVVEVQRYKKYGKLYGLYEGTRPVLTVADPDILRDILVKDFQAFADRRDMRFGEPLIDNMVQVLNGEDWKRVRTLITPAFSTGKIKRMTSIILDSSKTLTENFLKNAKNETPVDVKRLFGTYSMDVIASTAFATKIDSHNDPNNLFVTIAKKFLGGNIPWRFVLAALFPSIMKLFKISVFSSEVLKFYRDITLQIIKERKRTGQKKNDFLQLMMDAAKENLDEDVKMEKNSQKNDDNDNAKEYGHEEINDQVFKTAHHYKSLSYDELVAQCVLFFLAGYENNASTLSYVAYSLALNPEIQEKLIKEIDDAVAEEGELTYEVIREMKYLDNVISETLRKFSITLRLERLAVEDYELKGENFTIPKGMLVGVPIYAMHHDAEFYPEPENFDPDRFTPEVKSTRHSFAYLPFGAGPRNCLGMRFALMQIKIALVYVLRHLRFRACSKTKVPLDFYFGIGALSCKEVTLLIEARNA